MPSPIGNFFVKAIVNSPFHSLLGDSIAVISVDGWKTGRRVSTPINVRRELDGWIVISMRKRTWWRNLPRRADRAPAPRRSTNTGAR